MSKNKSQPTSLAEMQTLYARGKHVQFKDAPTNDQLLDMVLALSSELSVLRDRIDTHERLAADNTPPTHRAVDGYDPDEETSAARSTQRQNLLRKIFWTLKVSFARRLDSGAERK